MKNLIYSIISLSLCFGSFSCSSNATESSQLPEPKIKCGVAKISGKFKGFNELIKHEEGHSAFCQIIKPLTGRDEIIKLEIKEDESFSLEIPIETSPTLGYISFFSDITYTFPLISGEETIFDVNFKDEKIHIEWKSGPDFLFIDTNIWHDAFGKALQAGPLSTVRFEQYDLDTIKRFIADPKEYIPYAIKYDLGNRLELLGRNKKTPKRVLNNLANEVRLMRIPQFIHFSGDIWDMYKSYNRYQEAVSGIKNELDTITYLPPDPDISYWVFLKEFDLNNPQYLYTIKLSYVIQMFLANETLSIPQIEEKPIDEWMKQTKNILADLVGFEDGIFYDILLCNAYSRQFVNRLEPLSSTQIENIKNYYKGGEVEKILLRENKTIVRLDEKRHPTVINETPNVPNEQLIDSIVSKYKGKVVLIDFWATWCGPCMDAMTEMAEMKADLRNKDVVFVYITDESSPKNKWEEVIPGIGGEHYYFTRSKYESVWNNLGLRGVPSYQFYDREGRLHEQVTGFSGIDRTRKKIDMLLSE